MTDYVYKTQKYKNKIKQLQAGARSEDDKQVHIDLMLIYPQRAIVNINNVSNGEILLSGYVEDSVKFLADDTLLEYTIRSRDTIGQKINQNAIVTVMTDNGNVSGKLADFNDNSITIIRNGLLIIIKKWRQIMLKSDYIKSTLITSNTGNLQYRLNTIGWNPIYDLYLDSDDLESNNQGKFNLTALISNNTQTDIEIDKTVLVAGNVIIEENARLESHAQRLTAAAPLREPIEEIPFAELITFPINKKLLIQGKKYSLPLYKATVNAEKIYQFDVNHYIDPNVKFIEANHGYLLTVADRELPAGLLNINAKSAALKTSVLLGAVRINRTPKGMPVEVIIGKTSRVRAIINRTDSSANHEDGIIKREKYTIVDVKITGEIINDTREQQNVVVREWAGNSTIIKIDPEPEKNLGYLEWHYKIKPGKTPINISYQSR